MSSLEVKIKKLHPNAEVPKYATVGDAGLDLVAVSQKLTTKGYLEMGTGLAFELPPGYVGLVFPRSSISNLNMSLTNSVGVIDSGYRGEVTFRFKGANAGNGHYKVGDKIGQLIILPYPQVELVEVEELNETERGIGGYGSTDEAKQEA